MWSKLTPKPVDSHSLRQLLAQETVFSEEPMMAVFESLGIHVPWNATS